MIQLIFAFFFSCLGLMTPAPAGKIHLIIQETVVDHGHVQVLIFNQEEGFPSEIDKAWKRLSLPVENKKAEIIIPDVEPGSYAVSVFHDEDMDGEIKTNAIGYPLDKFGFSNNPSLLFGAPSFSKASFEVTDQEVKVKIKLR